MSGHQHPSEDMLLDAVYGIAGSMVEAHLGECAECARRLSKWHQKRAASVASVEISSRFLAEQRQHIYARIERPSRKLWVWAPGLAAACALAIGVFAYLPGVHSTHPMAKEQPAQRAEISDTQLFGEVYSMEQTLEPAATAPARALFEGQQ